MHRLANPFLGGLRIQMLEPEARRIIVRKANETVNTADLGEEEKEQQRLLIPGSGVSSPDISQMVMRK